MKSYRTCHATAIQQASPDLFPDTTTIKCDHDDHDYDDHDYDDHNYDDDQLMYDGHNHGGGDDMMRPFKY